ncbi:MAG TPA: CopD family protein [Bacillota bacterium]|nr:CopD family protein [Bacillota bacterium]
MRKLPFIFLCVILALAVFGFMISLATEPLQLLLSTGKMLLVAAVFFAIVYFLFFRHRQHNNTSKKYKQAVKQSQKKYGNVQDKQAFKRATHASKKKSKRNASHLRVIEGNKSKKDDHASF